jgi:hypothetical protein
VTNPDVRFNPFEAARRWRTTESVPTPPSTVPNAASSKEASDGKTRRTNLDVRIK